MIPLLLLPLVAFCATEQIVSESSNCTLALCDDSYPLPVCFVCANGFACSTVEGRTMLDPGLCRRCLHGEFCPQATLNPLGDTQALLCPAGSLCTTPHTMEPCPAGYFCPQGTWNQDPFECTMKGTYCGQGFSLPKECPGGYYCETTKKKTKCPTGYYCNPSSIEPRACPAMANCSEGSASPGASWGGLVAILVFLVVYTALYQGVKFLIRKRQEANKGGLQAKIQTSNMLAQLFGDLAGADLPPYDFQGFKQRTTPVSIQFKDLGLTLKSGSKKCILKGVTGGFSPSRLIAVMGPSGAGKSTFLYALCGKAGSYADRTGSIMINEKECEMNKLKRVMGFVPQDDTVRGDLTVYENLVFSAHTRLPVSMPVEQKLDIVDDVLAILRLDHVADEVVGSVEKRGISGGQRKRVNIGMELVADPLLLFLDEPTSGLDATAARDILSSLQQLARLGITIISVIHQPRYSIFTMFDDVLLLGPGGRTVYIGPSGKAMPYFNQLGFPCPPTENPADHFLDVISGSVRRQGKDGKEIPFTAKELFTTWEEGGIARVEALHDDFAVEKAKVKKKGLSPEQIQRLWDAYDSIDKDGYGLNAEELQKMLQGLGFKCSEEESKKLIAHMDTSRTGVVSRMEFLEMARDFTGTLEVYSDFNAQLAVRTHMKHTMASDAGEDAKKNPRSISLVKSYHSRRVRTESVRQKPNASSGAVDQELNLAVAESLMAGDSGKKILKNIQTPQTTSLFERRTPNFFVQLQVFTHRSLMQTIRGADMIAMDFGLFVFAAFFVGLVYGSDEGLENMTAVMFMGLLALGVCMTVSAVRLLGGERVVYWREAASGINTLSYYVARNITYSFTWVIGPLLFLTTYYAQVLPRGSFGDYFAVFLLSCWAMSGIGILISTLMIPANATIAAVAYPMVFGGAVSAVNPTLKKLKDGPVYIFSFVSYVRWGVEALCIRECEAYPSYMDDQTDSFFKSMGYNRHNWTIDLLALGLMGGLSRIAAYFGMIWVNRAKQI